LILFFSLTEKIFAQHDNFIQGDTSIVCAYEFSQDIELDQNNSLSKGVDIRDQETKLLKLLIKLENSLLFDQNNLTNTIFDAIGKHKMGIYADSLCLKDTTENVLNISYVHYSGGCAYENSMYNAQNVAFYRLKGTMCYDKNTKSWKVINGRMGVFVKKKRFFGSKSAIKRLIMQVKILIGRKPFLMFNFR
jgi:hypothetical protein